MQNQICKLQRVEYIYSVFGLWMRLLLERRKIGERKVETKKNMGLFGLKKENVILMGPETRTYQNIISPSQEANQRENGNNYFGRKCHHHNIPIFLSSTFSSPNQTKRRQTYCIQCTRDASFWPFDMQIVKKASN